MTDVHDKATRSYNMSKIKACNTKPELKVRQFLFSNGYRFRLHNKDLPGKPDIVLKKYNAAIFVNGCFWHGHKGCKYFVMPKTRTEWWKEKIEGTIKRDQKHLKDLKELGWNSIVIWECDLKSLKLIDTLHELQKNVTSNN
jgi:DNA mismatch endonuclease (patch repair protein)